MEHLDSLIKHLLNQQQSKGSWRITRDTILELLKLDIRDVYSLLLESTNPLVNFQTGEFTDEEAGALISLLEYLGYDRAAVGFWQAGLWIPWEVQIELQEALVQEIVSARTRHTPDYDEYLAIFDHNPRFIRSVEIYLEEFFSQDEITGRAIAGLLLSHSREPGSSTAVLLQRLAHELIRREIVPYAYMFSGIYSRFRAFLVARGRLETPRQPAQPVDREQLEARQLFGYSADDRIVKADLKIRYKKLMKQYHPDVNPRGQEMARGINRAYSVLVS